MARHHYLPQFYLKRFTDRSRGQEPFLWLVNAVTKDVSRKAPKNAAAMTGLYDWKTDYDWSTVGGQPFSVEAFFSQVESRVAPIIKRLEPDDISVTEEERYHLTNFVALQLMRTPASLEIVERSEQRAYRRRLEELVADTKQFKARYDAFVATRGPAEAVQNPEEFKRALLEKPPVLVRDADRTLVWSLKAALEIIAPLVFSLRWDWLVPAAGLDFFTSDRPASLHTAGPSSHFEAADPRLRLVEVSFVVSPRLRLLAHNASAPKPTVTRLANAETHNLNVAMLSVVGEYFYCSNEPLARWIASSI